MSDKDTARVMYWLLNVGFAVIAVDCLTVQWTVPGVVGGAIMAVSITWACWKDGI